MPEQPPNSEPVLVAQSPQMQSIRQKIEKLGRSECPVLLLGETGTGKEVVARLIHYLAGPQRPFVAIDCGSLVETLLESELFGYARGAFTGAIAEKRGLLEMADGGTAFLDEVGELPRSLQAKLLRVLQSKEIRPVGSVHCRQTRFRVIAATNRDLSREVEVGRFRRDLYYRLNVISLRLPPLRERREDLDALIDYFLERQGHGFTVGVELRQALLSYDWPGNVRELENCIERLVAINSGPVLQLRDLPSALQLALTSVGPRAAAAVATASSGVLPMQEAERQAIQNALKTTGGNRAHAASLLGIGRTTLYRKMKEYRLEPAANQPAPGEAPPPAR